MFVGTGSSTSSRLAAAIDRHTETTIGPALAAAKTSAPHRLGNELELLHELELIVHSADELLGLATDYSYNVTIRAATASDAARAEARCVSIYGCMYALESFAQLLDTQRGAVLHSRVDIVDVRSLVSNHGSSV